MTEAHGYLKQLLGNLRRVREQANLSEAYLEERLILGAGGIRRFEQGEPIPSIDMLLAILHETHSSLEELLKDLPSHPDAAEVERQIFAEPDGKNIVVHFRYANFDAVYPLSNATMDQFEAVIKTLRDGLVRLTNVQDGLGAAIKTDSVAKAFLKA